MGGAKQAICWIFRPIPPLAFVCCLGVLFTAGDAVAEEIRYFEKDGITYRETRRVVQRPVIETKYEQRKQIFYREEYKTDMQQSYQTVQVPVTEYRTMACLQNRWNPFAQPYYTYKTVPVQRMEVRQQVVQHPVTRRELVPEERIVQIPVTSQRIAEEEQITRVVVSSAPPGTVVYGQSAVSGPIGGVARLDGGSPTAATANAATTSSTFAPYNSQMATRPGMGTTPSGSLATRPSTATLSPSSSLAPTTSRTGAAPQQLSPAPAARPATNPSSTIPGGRY